MGSTKHTASAVKFVPGRVNMSSSKKVLVKGDKKVNCSMFIRANSIKEEGPLKEFLDESFQSKLSTKGGPTPKRFVMIKSPPQSAMADKNRSFSACPSKSNLTNKTGKYDALLASIKFKGNKKPIRESAASEKHKVGNQLQNIKVELITPRPIEYAPVPQPKPDMSDKENSNAGNLKLTNTKQTHIANRRSSVTTECLKLLSKDVSNLDWPCQITKK